jgi:two-component system OmpR family response regulator
MSPEVESASSRRVLVVDDEPDILAVVRITLRARGGFEVELCQSGEAAVGVARRFAPDLILLDVMMPGLDGPATLRALRDEPETATTPVVFLTAQTTRQDTLHHLELGAAAVIAKPFDQRTLVEELQQITQAAASRTAAEDDPELAELLDTYEKSLPQKIREIRELWVQLESEADVEVARSFYRGVHNLAGTAATFGHPKLSEAARRIEQKVGSGPAGVVEQTPALRRDIAALIEVLEATARSGRRR